MARPASLWTPIPPAIEQALIAMATDNPWYGYKRIAVMRRRAAHAVTNRQCHKVMKQHGLLAQTGKARAAEVYQAAKLFELLPSGPNELWQIDVTYLHIPGCGWCYAVTVIGSYSRYLPAVYLTPNCSALAATEALALARQEAERLCGPLVKPPFLVSDNGSTFIAKRFVEFTREDYCQGSMPFLLARAQRIADARQLLSEAGTALRNSSAVCNAGHGKMLR